MGRIHYQSHKVDGPSIGCKLLLKSTSRTDHPKKDEVPKKSIKMDGYTKSTKMDESS